MFKLVRLPTRSISNKVVSKEIATFFTYSEAFKLCELLNKQCDKYQLGCCFKVEIVNV